MKLILTRDHRGIVQRLELADVTFNEAGRVERPNVMVTQITDKANQRPVVGIELATYEGFELVQEAAP